MSEPVLRTHTERCRDQKRIEGLEAELAVAWAQADRLARAYTDTLDALAEANWHSAGVVWQHALWFIVGAMATVVAMRWLT